jgi:hypothetical protein
VNNTFLDFINNSWLFVQGIADRVASPTLAQYETPVVVNETVEIAAGSPKKTVSRSRKMRGGFTNYFE